MGFRVTAAMCFAAGKRLCQNLVSQTGRAHAFQAHDHHLRSPAILTVDRDGAVTRTGGAEITMAIQKAGVKRDRLELAIHDDDFIVTPEKDAVT